MGRFNLWLVGLVHGGHKLLLAAFKSTCLACFASCLFESLESCSELTLGLMCSLAMFFPLAEFLDLTGSPYPSRAFEVLV